MTGQAARRRPVAALDPAGLRRQPGAARDRLHRHLLPAQGRPETPIAETVGAIGDLIRAGKIRYFGVSNYRGWRIAEVVSECEAQGVPRPVVCQPYYNLLNRMPEVEILPACDYYGIGVAPYSPIARGVLTGKYARAAAARRFARREQGPADDGDGVPRGVVRHRGEIGVACKETGRSPTQFALAWLWANQIVTSVIAGPRTLEQWQEYVGARHGVERRRRGAGGFARAARTSVDARLQRSPISVLRADPGLGCRPACSTSSRRAAGAHPRLRRTAAGSPAATADTTSARRTRTKGCRRS